MSFGFGTGFGSSNNNPQPSSGFGGGFGTSNNTGFGQQQSSGFGGATNTTGGGIFGSGGAGFGASASTPFGTAKPAFGASTTSSGGLFGSTTATSGGTTFSGFGASNPNTTSSSAFGGGATGGGMFGNPTKPAFGTGTSTTGGLFGTGNNGTAFGAGTSQPTSVFGGPPSTALGGNNAECQGTGSTPFQAFTEKDTPGSSQTNHFQSISFMQPYQKFSFEELRLADYNQGRRYGNSSGQAGAFGVNTGFGGFGQNNSQGTGTGFGSTGGGGLFGSQPASTPSTFGTTTQPTGGGFGTTSGGLFGAPKPGAGGLFGGGGGASTTSQPAGGFFGTPGTTAGAGFGTSSGGSGLFGTGTTQQQQAKPFAFGTSGATTTAGTGFGGWGSGTATSGGGGGLFGTAPSQPPSIFSGQQQQTPASNPPFGGFGTNNTNQPKPGVFGSTSNTGGGLFGTTTQNNQTGLTGGFGTANNQTSSLFGAKPEAAGTGSLFGGTNNSNTNGGLFGNNNNVNNQNPQGLGGGLFGGANQQQPKSNVFGSTNTGFGNTGGGLFNNANNNSSSFNGLGSNNQNQQGTGLFSGSTNNNGSSLFRVPQQNNLQPPEAMTASIFDRNPYGNSSIFAGLPPPPQASPGPIATPISAGQPKPKKQAPLLYHRFNSPMSSRLQTPQKRGYGFTYSTYGTPSSASSIASTPGGLSLNNSLLGSSIGRSLGKSFSTSNLRRNFDNDADTILAPGAFSAGSVRQNGAGSLKRLTIDRNLRTNLFGNQVSAALPSPDKNDQSKQSSILKKKVSFDTTTIGGNGIENGMNGTSDESSSMADNASIPTPQELGYLRSSSRTNGRSNGAKPAAPAAQPEMEQVKGNELTIVHEDESPENSRSLVPANHDQSDPVPGPYYTRPSREELRRMPREKLKKISGFEVGREGCGHVVFDEPVDLTTVDVDNIFDIIAVITIRSLTVYPQTDKKPPVGMGLNVPSTITLENSWPRGRDRKTPTYEKSGPKFNKHVERLRRVAGTEFVKYDKDTGEWVFRVPHFTTYALDYDDDETMEGETYQSSVSNESPSTPTPKSRHTPKPPRTAQESSLLSEEASQVSAGPDDTFEFQRKRLFPGAYDNTAAFEDDQEMEEFQQNGQPFLGQRSAPSPSEIGVEEPSDYEEETGELADESLIIQDEEMEMAGSFPQQLEQGDDDLRATDDFQLKSILKASQVESSTPRKAMMMGDDWAEQLQRTISPRKHDRQALRESQARIFREEMVELEETPMPEPLSRRGNGFATSIDLMNSIFGKEELRKSGGNIKQARKAKGFEWPYPKKSKNFDDLPEMTEADRAFHNSFKPTWGSGSTLLYGASKPAAADQRSITSSSIPRGDNGTIASEGRDIRSLKITSPTPDHFSKYRDRSEVFDSRGVPYAEVKRLSFRSYSSTSSTTTHEGLVWELASILFDDLDIDSNSSVPISHILDFNHRIRKDRLSSFWARICQDQALATVASATTAEERAIAFLSMNKVAEACDALVDGKDYRLATIVAQIGGDPVIHDGMRNQLGQWRKLDALSEMTDPIRALYELAAGNTCVCEGVASKRIVDRVETFIISDRFNLDWKRSFGLRLWYAIQTDEPIEAAVKKFATDLQEVESKKPVPSFRAEAFSIPRRDDHADAREDVLWGLLKLYAESQDGTNTTRLADAVMPPNATGNPMDSRFSFELYQALSTRFPAHSDPTRADQLTWDFAVQLEASKHWHGAILVILHLSGPTQRRKALEDLLARHASDIEESDVEQFRTLTEIFKIPEAWIWDAKAVYARAVQQDHVKEVDYLLRGRNWDEAHKTLCRIVAPHAIIEEDYDTLFGLLESFRRRDMVADWNMGGQVYEDYVRLMKGLQGRERQVVLKRLVGSLAALVQDRPGKLGFAEMVAVQEMSAVVGRTVLADKEKTADGFRVLRLPLTGDKHLQHTMDLSLSYYQALMATGSKELTIFSERWAGVDSLAKHSRTENNTLMDEYIPTVGVPLEDLKLSSGVAGA